MPSLQVATNVQADKSTLELLIKELSAGISPLSGKPEKVIVVYVINNIPLSFAGDAKEPGAFLSYSGIGGIEGKQSQYTELFSNLLKKHLQISAERVHVTFTDVEAKNWGWNGKALA